MPNDHQSQIAFYLTGKRTGDGLDPIEDLGLRPALLAGYRDLGALRYDFPAVLGAQVESLTNVVDAALAKLPEDGESGRIRKLALRVEHDMRKMAAKGKTGRFSTLWDLAAKQVPGAEALAKLRSLIHTDGELVDCDRHFGGRILLHAWNAAQESKGKQFRSRVDRLLLRLNNILKADRAGSNPGRSADSLRTAFGGPASAVIDFEAMAEILKSAVPESKLSGSRRQRIRWVADTLTAQTFFGADGKPGHDFVFSSCAKALHAYQDRLKQAVELAKAIAIAELEVEGDYIESKHDRIFRDFGNGGLDPRDLAWLPDYLVRLDAAKLSASEADHLVELLTAGLPFKIAVLTDDILAPSSLTEGHLVLGGRARQLAHTALALTDVFVLQSPASNLVKAKGRLEDAFGYAGPALFCIFSGASPETSGVAPYLVGAASMECRAFPAFTYDPSAGSDWATRFSLAGNWQPDRDWTAQHFSYEDESLQRVSEEVDFTLADFVSFDRRFQGHFARVPKAAWNGSMASLTEALRLNPKAQVSSAKLPDRAPCLLMVDDRGHLNKVLISDALVRESARCLEMWRSLQELGGLHNSHTERALQFERARYEELLARERAAAAAKPVPTASASAVESPSQPAAAAVVAVPESVAEERNRDEAYIETPRCTSCNECTQVNSKMFAYDENKQAYIADVKAGTFRQLVEAAEGCQVSIIHPGKPSNANEPGLDDLIKRAEPFL